MCSLHFTQAFHPRPFLTQLRQVNFPTVDGCSDQPQQDRSEIANWAMIDRNQVISLDLSNDLRRPNVPGVAGGDVIDVEDPEDALAHQPAGEAPVGCRSGGACPSTD